MLLNSLSKNSTDLSKTATNLESVNLSPLELGKMAARMRVKRPEVLDKQLTVPG